MSPTICTHYGVRFGRFFYSFILYLWYVPYCTFAGVHWNAICHLNFRQQQHIFAALVVSAFSHHHSPYCPCRFPPLYVPESRNILPIALTFDLLLHTSFAFHPSRNNRLVIRAHCPIRSIAYFAPFSPSRRLSHQSRACLGTISAINFFLDFLVAYCVVVPGVTDPAYLRLYRVPVVVNPLLLIVEVPWFVSSILPDLRFDRQVWFSHNRAGVISSVTQV